VGKPKVGGTPTFGFRLVVVAKPPTRACVVVVVVAARARGSACACARISGRNGHSVLVPAVVVVVVAKPPMWWDYSVTHRSSVQI
jgi:hypothetical protein